MSEKAPFMVFSGTNSRYLAEKICASLNCPLGKMNITHFADGEFAVSYEESIRGANVFLVQSTFPNSDNLMELLLMVDAAKRASAKSVIAVIPYFGWARQDRKDKPRVSIGAKLVADLLSVAGIDRLITMDLHADQIQGFFNIPVDHLYASAVFLPYIESLKLDDLVIATPDVGGSKRASTFSKYLGVPLVLCNKTREKANVVATMQIIGDVKDKKLNDSGELKQNYSSYLELNYPFSVKNVDLNVTCGAVPYKAEGIYTNSGFAVTNVALKGMTEIKINDKFSLPIFAQAIWNPCVEDAFLVFGVTLRP